MTFPTPGAVVVATGDTPAAADSLAALALRDAARLTEQRSARLAALLDDAPFDTADESFDKALDWARLTLDALVSRDSAGTMLLPGIPGAEPPPGRSALTALDAFLYPGAWDTARRLLTTFGRVQRFDERIDILGRAPNVVRPGGQGDFTSADATPLYIAAAGDYVRATGDRGLVSGEANFWFKTVFAMRGLYGESRRYGRQVDEDGFLRANDDQTWMQDGASRATLATPRGGLVVEGQGALYEALRSMTEFAQIMGVSQRESGRWYADSADVLLAQFPERFVRDGRVLDRLDPRRGPDATLRPNALLALDRLDLPPAERALLTRALAERLAYAHGVATRPQGDSLFHPFLDAPAYYAPEDARYNGAVWTWLSGPLIRLMAETGAPSQAYDLYGTSTELVLEDGVVGAIPDVLDAHPRASGERPRSGGAPVQPWSLAEYIRNAYEVFAGITYASASEVIVEPQLPESWGETATQVRMGRGHVRLALEQRGNALEAVLTPEGRLPTGAQARVRAFGLEAVVPLTADTLAAEPVTVRITPGGVEVAGEDVGEAGRYATPDASWWDGFAWVRPDLRDEYPVMRQAQAQRQLTPEQILRDNPAAEPILTQTDPDGDDWGATSTFTYPVGYPPSILDATYLEVVEDDSTTYFRAEFVDLAGTEALGYQPTFVVLALDMEGGGERRIGRNAGYDYPRGEGYEVVVFIGDGVRVEDARGRVLGEVPPSAGSVFDPATASLSFALPRFVLEDVPRGTSVTLLVGAREPGNGVGAFRSVARQASESVGGGKVDDRAPNVYDVITGRVSR